MSYILDALRKADAQRQRTRLPGLQAQPAPAPDEALEPVWRSPLPWALGAALLLVMGFLAWPRTPSPQAAPPVGTVVSAPAAPVAPSAAAPVVQAPPAESAAATAIQPAPPPPRTAAEPQPQPRVAVRSTPDREAPPRPARAPAEAPAANAPTASAPRPAPAASAAPVTGSAAPPGAPKLAITGGVYSADAAQRLLIVGGQVFSEGSEVAPGVVLEQVRPGQAVLSYQGQRFTARY